MSPPEAWAPKLPQAARNRNVEFPNERSRTVDLAKDRSRAPECVRDGITTSGLLAEEEFALNGPSSSKSDLVLTHSTDEELRSAIDALKKSTRAVERRTTILGTQQKHAKLFASSRDALDARKAGHLDSVVQRQAAELQHVKFANEQLFSSLRGDLQAQLGRVEKEVKSVPANVFALLNSDDRALDEFNELSSSVSSMQEGTVDVDALQQRVDKLSRALELFRVEALKDRLDRIYLEALTTADNQSEANTTADVLPKAVEEDLSLLYTEIGDMVTMVVAHEHRNTLGAALRHIRQTQIQEKRTANEKVDSGLRSLTATLEAVSTRLETLQLQRHNLHALETQIQQFEGNSRPRTISSRIAVRVEQKDTNTAKHALLRHLNLPTNTDKPTGKPDLIAHLYDLTTALEQRSFDNIAQILQAAQQAAMRRRAALESVSEALAANEYDSFAVSALEEGIIIAKAGIEAETTR